MSPFLEFKKHISIPLEDWHGLNIENGRLREEKSMQQKRADGFLKDFEAMRERVVYYESEEYAFQRKMQVDNARINKIMLVVLLFTLIVVSIVLYTTFKK